MFKSYIGRLLLLLLLLLLLCFLTFYVSSLLSFIVCVSILCCCCYCLCGCWHTTLINKDWIIIVIVTITTTTTTSSLQSILMKFAAGLLDYSNSICLTYIQVQTQHKILSLVVIINWKTGQSTRVGTLIVATIYWQLIQNRYMFRSFTVLQCSHQHCVQPFVSDVEVVGYL